MNQRAGAQFSFAATWAGDTGHFAEVSGFGPTSDDTNYREGGADAMVHHLPSSVTHTTLVLRHGVLPASSNCLKAIDMVQSVPVQTLDVSLLDERGAPVSSWTFEKAWVVHLKTSAFDAAQDDIAVEALEFAYSRVTQRTL